MTRIVALDEVDTKLKNYLSSKLNIRDASTVLPQAHLSAESGVCKNVVMRLSGEENAVNPDLFSPSWFAGVSIVQFPQAHAEKILSDPVMRQNVLSRLRDCIKSEMSDSQITCGPTLDGDGCDRDIDEWTAGFDGPSCCVGLYSAVQNRQPEAHASGMSRAHRSYFLVCKAGSGLAGHTFHTRISSALKNGATLDQALSDTGSPGARALRRVSTAGRRNRCRILVEAAEAMGFHIDTIGDNESPATKSYRLAIPAIDAVYNALLPIDQTGTSCWQYTAGCVEAAASTGCITCSNVAEGFVAFFNATGDLRFTVRNEAHNAIPFASERAVSNRDAVFKATDAHKAAKASTSDAHPDSKWVTTHFAWKSKSYDSSADVEPTGLWGSHHGERFVADWSRELGLSGAHAVRLQPEIVILSAVEPAKLRVALRAITAA